MTLGDVQAPSALERARTILLWLTAGAAVCLGLVAMTGDSETGWRATASTILLVIVVGGGILMGIAYVMHLRRNRAAGR